MGFWRRILSLFGGKSEKAEAVEEAPPPEEPALSEPPVAEPPAEQPAPAAPTETPPAAAETTPETEEIAPGLHWFIEDFLKPIAADGQLIEPEEAPLIVAFHAYGVAKQLQEDREATHAVLKEAIRAARGTAPPRPDQAELLAARRRVLRRASDLTKGEYASLKQWFAGRIESDDASPIPLDDDDAEPKFRDTPLDRSCVELFYVFIRDVGAELTPEAAEAEPAEPETTETQPAETAEPPPAKPEVAVRDAPAAEEAIERVLNGQLLDQLRDGAERLVEDLEALLEADGPLELAFHENRRGADDQAVVVDSLPEETALWFVGDIHGDLLALECALQYMDNYADSESSEPRACVVFLGDLFDDGELSYEAVLRVFQRVLERPEQTFLITGNHDESLGRDDSVFTSGVWPANFADWLNDRPDDAVAQRLGQLTIRFFAQAPRALFLPDGLLAAHGGVPHCDLLEGIASRDDLNSPQCLQDFVWTRIHPRAKKRIPNRTTRGCEVGRQDFEAFCAKASEVLGQPVQRMVRGHDHVDEEARYSVYDRYEKNHVLTINNMCYRLAREAFGPYERVPCVARWIPGQLPEVHRLRIPAEVIEQMYPLGDPEADSE